MDIKKYIGDIRILCRQNKVRTLYAFGSVLTDEFTESSDIDFIVEIDSDDPLEYADIRFFKMILKHKKLSKGILK